MLINVALALEEKLKGLSDVVGKDVFVTTDEGYAEIIAQAEREKGKIPYPVAVMRSGDYEIDRRRYTNDRVNVGYHDEIQDNGKTYTYNDFDMPYIPANLRYQIDLIAETRKDIDMMVLWVLSHIKDRDYLDVTYKGYDGNDAIYCSLVKRGTIVKADDREGNVISLRRRTFELELTTLIAADQIQSEITVEAVIPQTYLLNKE